MADPHGSLQKPGKRPGDQMDGMLKAGLIISVITIILTIGAIVYMNVAFG